MTERAALEQLIAKWRDAAAWEQDDGDARAAPIWDQCADELDALLRSRAEGETGWLLQELRDYLDALRINGDTIGDIRRSLFVPWDSRWNGIVRDETAAREQPSIARAVDPAGQEQEK